MVEDCTALILAGGKSKRMGRDKATAQLDGRPLWQHISAQLTPHFTQLLFSVREPRPDLPPAQVVDAFEGGGPMIGIASALAVMESEWLFAVGCDMPFVQPALIDCLASRRSADIDVVLAEVDGHRQPLLALYAKRALPAMRARIARGERSLQALIADDLRAVIVGDSVLRRIDGALRSFMDLDTPALLQSVQMDGDLGGR